MKGFGRFSNRCTLYEDSEDERFTNTELTTPENTITYHNTLFVTPKFCISIVFSFSWGRGPKRNWRQCLCKILGWQTKSIMVCYGIFWSGQYQTSANLWKINATRELVRQSEAKRKQAPQSEANVFRRRRRRQTCNLEKTSLNKLHRTPNNAQNPQHKLGVVFSYLERKKKNQG